MPDMVTDKPYKCTLNFTFAPYCFSSAVVGEGNVFRLEFYDIIFFLICLRSFYFRSFALTIKMCVLSFRSMKYKSK